MKEKNKKREFLGVCLRISDLFGIKVSDLRLIVFISFIFFPHFVFCSYLSLAILFLIITPITKSSLVSFKYFKSNNKHKEESELEKSKTKTDNNDDIHYFDL